MNGLCPSSVFLLHVSTFSSLYRRMHPSLFPTQMNYCNIVKRSSYPRDFASTVCSSVLLAAHSSTALDWIIHPFSLPTPFMANQFISSLVTNLLKMTCPPRNLKLCDAGFGHYATGFTLFAQSEHLPIMSTLLFSSHSTHTTGHICFRAIQ